MLALAARLAFALMAAAPTLRAGQPAPEAFEIDTLGEGRQLVELRGRITIVDFFATWCPHCRESLASTPRLVRAIGDRARVVIVDVEEDPATVNGFFASHPPPAGVTVGLDHTGKVYRSFGARGFPTFAVIDERGVVRRIFSGWGDDSAADLAEWVDYIVKKSAALPAPRARRQGKASAAKERAGREAAATRTADEQARRLGVEVLH